MNFCNGTEKLETVDVGSNQLLGAVFDFYAGTLRRSTKIWIESRFGLASKTNQGAKASMEEELYFDSIISEGHK